MAQAGAEGTGHSRKDSGGAEPRAGHQGNLPSTAGKAGRQGDVPSYWLQHLLVTEKSFGLVR